MCPRHVGLGAPSGSALRGRRAQQRTYLHVLPGPVVQANRLDLGHVCAEATVDAAAVDAHERAQVDGGPLRLCTGKDRASDIHKKWPCSPELAERPHLSPAHTEIAARGASDECNPTPQVGSTSAHRLQISYRRP